MLARTKIGRMSLAKIEKRRYRRPTVPLG
jgi:hypothetical protein